MKPRNKWPGAVLGLALLAAGCGPIVELPGGGPAPDLYSLSRATTAGQAQAATPLRLMIDEIAAAPDLATDRIARREGGISVNYSAGARWSDPIGRLIRDRLVESFENVAGVTALSRDVIDVSPDYRLKLRLRDFNAAADTGAPNVALRFTALIISASGPNIVAQRQFSYQERAAADNAAKVVASLDSLFAQASQDLMRWTLSEVASQAEGS